MNILNKRVSQGSNRTPFRPLKYILGASALGIVVIFLIALGLLLFGLFAIPDFNNTITTEARSFFWFNPHILRCLSYLP